MLDVIVVGGGHAGIEAALATARMGKETVLYTLHLSMIGSMPCNPSVGGPAKGIVVREIDALGGEMGRAADATALQFKMLNTTKGPGVQSLRVQSDKIAYKAYMQDVLQKQEHLRVEEACVEEILVRDGKACGVRLADGQTVESRAIILTSGTFMSSTILVGHQATSSGPEGEPTTNALSQSLRSHGIRTFRLKTGTPARVKTASIDFSGLEVQPGTKDFVCFSEDTEEILPFEQQMVCYLTYTSPQTHAIIQEHLQESAMYSGLVKGVGPRYCPSIEDKLVRFADKPRHQIFLEPESRSLDTTYVQGFSTSMPHDVQEKMLHSLPGLEHCEIDKFGYAIEYDAIDPLQCRPTLENKVIAHLFTAGQINGTSGYEEAAAQGLIAGINAVAALDGTDGLILGRDEAYIGVMIDDLVTKGTNEPYRLLTSRAEYRLLLRHDNADIRLTGYGHERGLISEERYQRFLQKQQAIETGMQMVKDVRFTPKSAVNEYLQALGYEPLKEGISAFELLRRPKVTIAGLQPYADLSIDAKAARQIEIEIKYEGYIAKARRDARHLRAMDQMRIPKGMDYATIEHLSLEARQKLAQIQPMTLGQASRISGVNPADLAVLAMVIKQR
ncbi:tRNA uridine-5-carboxymethylaminomethyl(34) synthesis enzyme MnmG [Amedibacillus dolichus]|uniref:tRNA uridine 5-carboxymethylaminomethyl modification enzyme MnmG n=1 Tax=Amedibacillus dolichus TaxID=31971 RepID=A0ABT7UC63_9FIRM|nr:tRNA uridine-5-carboxymethylaminomethyl(34) synthesis enzyme MnmG [Amedibacillus dolichus]MDM8156975.1 tRNA uridine-5-carboxymethylaminomethyl(34) synthesis enzyme MnmG [Amedibacillus dolichus]